MPDRAGALLMTLCLLTPVHAAEEADADRAGPPSLELLEFLGQWETDDGEWVDPEELESDVYRELERRVAEEEEE